MGKNNTHKENKTLKTSPLHIKLGLIKNFPKAMTKHRSNDFELFCKTFFKLSQAKLKIGIFVGLGIRDVFPHFEKLKIHWNYELGMHLNGFAQILWNISSHLHIFLSLIINQLSRRCCEEGVTKYLFMPKA